MEKYLTGVVNINLHSAEFGHLHPFNTASSENITMTVFAS